MKIFDHIHGYITICSSAKKIIDTKEFQRLRNIKQLGCVSLVFPSASHTRFEHSLGVYHMSCLYMRIMNKKQIYFNPKQYELISIAALIHDLGHGPFSHLFDNYVTNTEHEYRSIEIFKKLNSNYKFGYTEQDIEFMYNVIHPPDNLVDDNKYLYQIVSNKNGIDVDRFDYMLRDLKMTGIENRYDFDYNSLIYIMENSVIMNNEFLYKDNIRYLLDMFFQTRFVIYKKICNHKTVKSLEIMMGEILENLETTFQINDTIKNKDWDKFSTFTDNIVYSLDFLSKETKQNDYAFQLYKRIKQRNIYKLKEEYSIYDLNKINEINSHLEEKYEKNNYIISISTIRYYSDEYPKILMYNDEINENHFKNKGQDIYLVKVFQKNPT